MTEAIVDLALGGLLVGFHYTLKHSHRAKRAERQRRRVQS